MARSNHDYEPYSSGKASEHHGIAGKHELRTRRESSLTNHS